MRKSHGAPEPRTITPEKPHFQQSASDTTPISTFLCLKMRFSMKSASRSSTSLRKGSQNSADILDELFGKILMHAARPEIGRVHARTRGALVEDHQLLALLEAPERRRERADIHDLRRHVEEMGKEPSDLAIEHADQLAALGHLDAEKALHGEREGMLLIHRRDVIEPVEIRHRLQIGLVLDQLLGAAMQEADVRIDPLDHFPVELEHEAQHAMRGRVLRAEIDGEVAELVFGHLSE